MATAACTDDAVDECREDAVALRLKMVAIVTILLAGVNGVAIPLLGHRLRFLRTDGGLFVLAKAFAAGVILATGLVHMLDDAQSTLTDSCLPESPWRRFPFSGFVAMMAALGTLVIYFVGIQFYVRGEAPGGGLRGKASATAAAAGATTVPEEVITIISVAPELEAVAVTEDDVKSSMHIIGMHAYAAKHGNCHAHEHGACDGPAQRQCGPGHAHENKGAGEVSSHVRRTVVSQARCLPNSNS